MPVNSYSLILYIFAPLLLTERYKDVGLILKPKTRVNEWLDYSDERQKKTVKMRGLYSQHTRKHYQNTINGTREFCLSYVMLVPIILF